MAKIEIISMPKICWAEEVKIWGEKRENHYHEVGKKKKKKETF